MEITDGRKEKRLEIEKKERSSWRYLFGRWIFQISSLLIIIIYPLSSIIHLYGIPNIFDMNNIYWEGGEFNLSVDSVKWILILFLLNLITIRFFILRGKNSIFTISNGGFINYPDREWDIPVKNFFRNLFFYLLIFHSLGIFFNPVNWETSINPLTNNSSIFPYYVIHILFLLYFLISYIVVSNIKVETDD